MASRRLAAATIGASALAVMAWQPPAVADEGRGLSLAEAVRTAIANDAELYIAREASALPAPLATIPRRCTSLARRCELVAERCCNTAQARAHSRMTRRE
jgi:hypothetical protein